LRHDITTQLALYRREVEVLPEDGFVELSYRELVESPSSTLERLGAYLELETREPLDSVQPRPRAGDLHPEVERVRARFVRALEKRGLWERFVKT
jgi:hypothetical protein